MLAHGNAVGMLDVRYTDPTEIATSARTGLLAMTGAGFGVNAGSPTHCVLVFPGFPLPRE